MLLGRPIALVQASLRLEIQGGPALNQSWEAFNASNMLGDNHLTEAQFPVILGDVQQVNDGLIGYFKQNPGQTAYDLSTFYSEGAQADAASGVVQPTTQATLSLTATPAPGFTDSPPAPGATLKMLMLVDPRSRVHATMGILPTKLIEIPPDQYVDTLGVLETTFLTTPILQGQSGFSIPVPQENGYQWSWVERDKSPDGRAMWTVTDDIEPVSGRGVWDYSPQRIVEGWLRLTPQLLAFDLVNNQGRAVVTCDTANNLTLTLTNLTGRQLCFQPGPISSESDAHPGSVICIDLSQLSSAQAIPNVRMEAPEWTFRCLEDSSHCSYWAAMPATDGIVLTSHATLTIAVTNLVVSATTMQAQVYFDYAHVDGLGNGVGEAVLAVQA